MKDLLSVVAVMFVALVVLYPETEILPEQIESQVSFAGQYNSYVGAAGEYSQNGGEGGATATILPPQYYYNIVCASNGCYCSEN